MEQLTPKSKIKFELAQFVTILVFVFWLWTAWASLNAKQVLILSKLDEVALFQKERVISADAKHLVIDKNFAWVLPTVHTLAVRAGLE